MNMTGPTGAPTRAHIHVYCSSLCRSQSDLRAGQHQHSPPGARSGRCADRHPVLRRLPLRPAHGAQRVGRWPTVYPCVPGHEIVGRVTRSAANVSGSRPAISPAVGCMVDSCRTCASCTEGLEQYCDTNGTIVHLQLPPTRQAPRAVTYGGYSDRIVVDEHFVLRVPARSSISPRSRRCCARASRPTRRCGTGAPGPGKKVGIVGLGGLGHMGVKFAHAFGAHTVLFTTSPAKVEDAQAARRGRGRALEGRRRDGEARAQLRLHPQHGRGLAQPRRRSSRCSSATATLVLVGVPEHPHPSPTVFQLIFGAALARGLADRRHRRDAGDARLLRASTTSSRTSR